MKPLAVILKGNVGYLNTTPPVTVVANRYYADIRHLLKKKGFEVIFAATISEIPEHARLVVDQTDTVPANSGIVVLQVSGLSNDYKSRQHYILTAKDINALKQLIRTVPKK